MSALDPRDRLMGGLVGLVVGDALGVPVEFTGREMRDQDPVIGMRGEGTWRQPAGTWSDDSSMALVTAETLAVDGWNPERMMMGFRMWLEQARWTARGHVFDVGNTTQNAIMYFRIHGDWQDCGLDEDINNGNGSLMRCLPVSCWLFGRGMEEQLARAGEVSALTHAHPRSRLCCAWHARWCDALLSGRDARGAVSIASDHLRRHVPPEERETLRRLLDGSVLDLERSQVNSDGYVVSTMEAATWCVVHHGSYADTVLDAVNLGGDTDTTAAVAGGMAGLRYGIGGIPREWIDAIARRDEVMELAGRFADACLNEWNRHGAP